MNPTMQFTLLTLISIFVHESMGAQIPVFADQFEVSFYETIKLGVLSGKTKGKMYLDYKSGSEVVTREHGHHDKVCATIYKFAQTPCNHYVVDHKRYIDFPEKKYCCYCCDSDHGCGIIAQDWMVKSNATFQGLYELDAGQKYQKWEIKGDSTNFYYNRDDEEQTPRRLVQGTSDTMDFYDYRQGPVDPSVFKLPAYCTDRCGAATACSLFRGDSLRAE